VLFLHLLRLVYQEYSASASGCAVRRVACEHCNQTYIYQLRLTAKGSAASLRFMNKTATRERAAARAQKKLHKRLAVEVAPNSCPNCGHYQRDMIVLLRKRVLRRIALSLFFLAVGLIILWIAEEQVASPAFTHATQFITALVICSLLGGFLWTFLHDFNRASHRRTRDMLGDKCQSMPAEEFDALLAGQSADLFADKIV
jgi:hypothetical protein